MPIPGLFLVTGLPATGKTTLARTLARALGVPLLSKDLIKEPLLDTLGAPDRAASRRLSDASFRVQFALADEYLAHGRAWCSKAISGPGSTRPHCSRCWPAMDSRSAPRCCAECRRRCGSSVSRTAPRRLRVIPDIRMRHGWRTRTPAAMPSWMLPGRGSSIPAPAMTEKPVVH